MSEEGKHKIERFGSGLRKENGDYFVGLLAARLPHGNSFSKDDVGHKSHPTVGFMRRSITFSPTEVLPNGLLSATILQFTNLNASHL
ncbi:unnamed protein product [Strongylus vulgaris]|uniref:Uncharacterized protein n=1 Tax=Strongylus vulgaris TaxID=40348 RepID=A0A3P7KRJ0_STRVU|nr:unnamed protein product [Strongylus vulgaris]